MEDVVPAMAQQLRLEFENAFCHITALNIRGNSMTEEVSVLVGVPPPQTSYIRRAMEAKKFTKRNGGSFCCAESSNNPILINVNLVLEYFLDD